MGLYSIHTSNFSSHPLLQSNTFSSASIVSSLFISSLLVISLSGCTSLSIDSARKLGNAGSEASNQLTSNIFYSDDKYERTMEAEAFLHGTAGVITPSQLTQNYITIQKELLARKNTFTKLSDVYDSFSQLASINSDTGMESAINDFGAATNSYAAALNKPAAFETNEVGLFAKIGGFTSREIQKRKLKESSALIRLRLHALRGLLSDPLVKSEIVDFGKNLTTTHGAAVDFLWKKDMFDATPLLDQFGSSAELKAAKDISKIIYDPKDSKVKNGLNAVITHRVKRKIDLIESNYDASVQMLGELEIRHQKLEEGEEIDLAKIRQIISELNTIASLLSKK